MREVIASLVCAIGIGCSLSNPTGTSPAPIPGDTSVTFHRDVEPLLQKSCQSCHVAGGIAPFPLVTYDDAKTYGDLIVAQTQARTMPPFGARTSSTCAPPLPYADDPSLSDAQLAMLQKWRDIGRPEGDPKDAPPPLAPPVMGIANPTITMTPDAGYTVADGGDQFRCFVLDPKVTSATYITAGAVLPGNSAVVHHMLLFADPKRESLAKAPIGGQYDCFGGSGITDSSLVMPWAPGGQPMKLPDGVAMPVDPGTLLVMQIHYHPSAQATNRMDKTSIQLKMDPTPPNYLALTRLIGNFNGPIPTAPGDGLQPDPDDRDKAEFRVPAGATAHSETMFFTLPAQIKGVPIPELSVLSTGGHMHYVGRDVRVGYKRASDQSEQCLLDIPQWDFSWQRGYAFQAPIDQLPKLHPGDRIEVKCTYDNSLDNPWLMKALMEQGLSQPKDVVLGESTLDEMCLGAFTFLVKR